MLQHVIEAQMADLVVGRVDLFVAVFHLRLRGHGRWIAVFTS